MKDKTLVLITNRNLMYFFAIFIVFIALLIRNTGLYPVVFGDETIYSKFSRLTPFEEAEVPSYIYLSIYRLTNICGDGFLGCARILNSIFFVTAMPFIYLTVKRICSANVASFVVLLGVLGPINSYTAYFMPEAMYFFSFWLFAWFFLGLDSSSPVRSWCFSGILLGIATLIKPHALFLLPALLTYILFVGIKQKCAWLQACKNATVFLIFTFLTKFLISYLFVGKVGLTLFGSFYTAIGSSAVLDLQRLIKIIVLSGVSIQGHILAICLMFGMPLAYASVASFQSITSKSEISTNQKFCFFALVIILSMIIITGLFTASVAGSEHEIITRLHMRYYNFAFPILIMIAASQLSSGATESTRKLRAIVGTPICAAILYIIYTHFASYTPGFVDSPELRGFTFDSTVFFVLSGISFFSLVLWVYAVRTGTKVFVYLFMPLVMGFSTYFINQELKTRLVPDVYDKAGMFTKNYLANEDISKVLIIGSDRVALYKSLFYLNNAQATFETILEDEAYDLSKLPAGKEWILVIGNHSLPDNIFFQIPMNGFTLARTKGDSNVDFKKSAWPGVISMTRGLSSAEAWGTWSTSDVVTFDYTMPLPEKFTMYLVGYAFGPNAGKDFSAQIGDNIIKFKLGDTNEERALEFINPARLKTIKIIIPAATSPKSLGLSNDERRLGIGLTQLRIVPIK